MINTLNGLYDITLGVLAVTRSLGDSAVKEYVVGTPYTTETDLVEGDEWLIIASDGVSIKFRYKSKRGSNLFDVALGCS